jgi:hypothetical protein
VVFLVVILLRGLLRRYPSSWSTSSLSFFVVYFVVILRRGLLVVILLRGLIRLNPSSWSTSS